MLFTVLYFYHTPNLILYIQLVFLLFVNFSVVRKKLSKNPMTEHPQTKEESKNNKNRDSVNYSALEYQRSKEICRRVHCPFLPLEIAKGQNFEFWLLLTVASSLKYG